MLDRIPHRGPTRQIIHAAAGACLGWVGPATSHSQNAISSHPTLFCVADLRLDNRAELADVLLDRGQPLPTDLEFIRLGYQRWGRALPDQLVGDFAFVIWDAARRCVFAARDAFGVRPLYYRRDPNGLALASEVEQLLVGQRGTLEPSVVLDYLLGDHRRSRETFFSGIFRLLPGHSLEATSERFREERYWRLPRNVGNADGADYIRQFRLRFRRAVADRMDSDRPVIAQLSGGLDSSSIVCTAAGLTAAVPAGSPALVACSALFPDHDCDENRYIQAVVRRTGVAWHGWNGSAIPGMVGAGFCISQPWAGTAPGTLEGDLALGLKLGAKGVLSGFGGDELLFERGIFRDLAANGRWLALLHQALLAPRYSSHSTVFFLRDALRSTAPFWLIRLYRQLGCRRLPEMPDWLGPALGPGFESRVPDEEPPPAGCSHTRWVNWSWLTSPNLWWSVELQSLRAARVGLERRFPFLDRRLADWALGLPYEYRLPSGRMKLMLRRTMKGLLPQSVALRTGVTTFDAVLRTNFIRNRNLIWGLLTDSKWRSAPFVDQTAARKLLQELDTDSSVEIGFPRFGLLLQLAQLELWLRFLDENYATLRDTSS